MIYIKRQHNDKWDRTREAIHLLDDLNIDYSMHNNGTHFIIEYNDKEIHYYPTTGRWRDIDYHKDTQQTYLKGFLTYLSISFIEID